MNSKKTTNSQLSTTEPKKQKQKLTTRMGTESQKWKTYLKKIMEKCPNLAKEIDLQEVQEAQRVPKKLDPKRNTPRHIIIRRENPKRSKRKGENYLQRGSH